MLYSILPGGFFYLLISSFLFFITSCSDSTRASQTKTIITQQQKEENNTLANENEAKSGKLLGGEIKTVTLKIISVRLPHHINTPASEYYPCPLPNGDLYFSAMDRTGYFDYQIDYTKTLKSGGEDVFRSTTSRGVWMDARPVGDLNTNAHEVITQVLPGGAYMMMGNYSENMGLRNAAKGLATPDLFLAKGDPFRVTHFPEPVNSIFGEYDGFLFDNGNAILFASDRPNGIIGEYHKKGWRWNENLWGNTDLYVSFKKDGFWSPPLSLGSSVNTPFAERTPWLSEDGMTLYISSNGHTKYNNDLDVYMFSRRDRTDWIHWDGPYQVTEVCTSSDEWCFRTDGSGGFYFARSVLLPYPPSQMAREGDGYIRETNYRTGYEVTGAQAAALRAEYQMDIFRAVPEKKPVLSLPDLLFAFNKANLTLDGIKDLEKVLDLAEQNPDMHIRVVGHTDDVGQGEYNRQLSLQRAQSVVDFLRQNGVHEKRISAEGLGSKQPISDNTTTSGRAKNRRVDFFFFK